MPRSTPRGRRTATQPTTTSKVVFGGSAAKQAIPFDDGEYQLHVEGARAVTSKRGATSIVITAKDVASDRYVLLRPLLVHSAGGDSQLVINNRAICEMIASVGEGEEIDLDEMLKRLNAGVTVMVELRYVVDGNGAPLSDIVDAWIEEA